MKKLLCLLLVCVSLCCVPKAQSAVLDGPEEWKGGHITWTSFYAPEIGFPVASEPNPGILTHGSFVYDKNAYYEGSYKRKLVYYPIMSYEYCAKYHQLPEQFVMDIDFFPEFVSDLSNAENEELSYPISSAILSVSITLESGKATFTTANTPATGSFTHNGYLYDFSMNFAPNLGNFVPSYDSTTGNTTYTAITEAGKDPDRHGLGFEISMTYKAITAPTPEPATMLLMGVGLAGLGFVARRRQK